MPARIRALTCCLAFVAPLLGACGEDPGGSGTASASSTTSLESTGTTAAPTTTDGSSGSLPTTGDASSTTSSASTGVEGSTTSTLTSGTDGSSTTTGPGCTPGELGCACIDGACAGGLACIDDVCVEPPSVCGDGQLDPPEMCELGEDKCNPDCTYEPGLVFWTDTYSNKGMDNATVGAWARTAAFDADDVPYVGDGRFGSYGLGAGGWVLRYQHDTGALDWQVRFTEGPWQLVTISGLSIQPTGAPVFGGQVNTGPATGNDAIFGQVTAAGVFGWGRQLEVEHTDWLTDTATLVDGSVVGVGGHSQHPDLSDRGWITSVSPTGLPQWEHDLDDGTPSQDVLAQVEAIDGDVVVFGCCDGDDSQHFLRRYDADGVEGWTTPIAGLDLLAFETSGLDVDADGNIYATWVTEADALWIAKFNADGELLWTATPADPELVGVYPRGIGVTPQGKLVVAGSRVVNATEDAFYGVFDEKGAYQWSDTVAGSFGGSDRFEDVAIDSRGLALVVGFRVQTGGPMGTYEAVVRLFAP